MAGLGHGSCCVGSSFFCFVLIKYLNGFTKINEKFHKNLVHEVGVVQDMWKEYFFYLLGKFAIGSFVI